MNLANTQVLTVAKRFNLPAVCIKCKLRAWSRKIFHLLAHIQRALAVPLHQDRETGRVCEFNFVSPALVQMVTSFLLILFPCRHSGPVVTAEAVFFYLFASIDIRKVFTEGTSQPLIRATLSRALFVLLAGALAESSVRPPAGNNSKNSNNSRFSSGSNNISNNRNRPSEIYSIQGISYVLFTLHHTIPKIA